MRFVARRASRLEKAEPLRRGELLPLVLQSCGRERLHAEFAGHVRDACLRLHGEHAQVDPIGGKRVSFGLVRMANIDPLFDVAQALLSLGAPEDTRIHLCVYHARFPLVHRSAIEHLLDASFNRRGDGLVVYRLPAVRQALDSHPERDQLFIVLASPVCEVGRDWDADWAVAEPSSMRSLIQLAGRVRRHRGGAVERPNVLVFDTNLRHFRGGACDRVAFVRPGFEKPNGKFQLDCHRLQELLSEDEYREITALPRVSPRLPQTWRPNRSLVDLEQARTATSMLPSSQEAYDGSRGPGPDLAYIAWKYRDAALTGLLPQQQPFRNDTMKTTTLAFLPDEDGETLHLHRIEQDRSRRNRSLYIPIEESRRHDVRVDAGSRISAWGGFDLMVLLAQQADLLDLSLRACAERMATVEVPASEQGWRYHPLLGFSKRIG